MRIESREARIAGGAWILEQFSLASSAHERNAARRVFSEVIRAWPGNVERLWWKWFSESAISLGLRSKTIDCTVDEAVAMAQEGSQLVVYHENSRYEWLAVLGTAGRRFEMARANGHNETRSISTRKLRKVLTSAATAGKVRCVVMQPKNADFASSQDEPKLTPFERLRQLLQPEWSDIWIVTIFAFVVGLLMLATPIAVEALVNTVAFGRFLQPIVVLAVILLTFLAFQAAVRGLQTYVVEIIQRRLFVRVAADLADRVPRAEAESTDGVYFPELVNRFFDIVTVQKVSAQLLLDGIGLVLSTVIGMAVLGFYHPWLLGFDILLLGSIAFIIFVLGRGAVPSAVKESKNKYYMAAWLEDMARCPATFRSGGGTEFALERADRLIHQYLSARKAHFRILMRQILFALGLQAIASTVLLGLGGWLVVTGELTLGQLVAAELIVTTIVGAFAKFGKHMESFYDLLASVDKLGLLIDLPTERRDGMLGTADDGPVRVELNAVSYGWPGGPATLDGVSTTLDSGASLAVVGQAGSGKSTLLDLMYGMRAPTAGHLTLNGFDPRDMRPDVLRNRVALVRSGEVFQATVEENVHLHREDIPASDVREALENTGVLDAVLGLRNGCDTMLTSGGAPLTENQCRLLGIARAIAGHPGLLLIDGVLDALPDRDVDRVLTYLLAPEQPWTVIVATGRESIAERCSLRLDLSQSSTSVKP